MRPLLRRVRERFPAPYARVRNGMSLAAMVARRLLPRSLEPDLYDDEFWDRIGAGDWPGFARAIIDVTQPRSVADVGCGQGLLLAAMHQEYPALRLAGVDGSPHAVARARRRGVDVSVVDLASMRRHVWRDAESLVSGVDLVICLETAEHLPPWAANRLVALITTGRQLVFSAATPNQGGTAHVNEQPFEYWLERFERVGFSLDSCDATLRRRVAALDLPFWYAANIHLLSRRLPR